MRIPILILGFKGLSSNNGSGNKNDKKAIGFYQQNNNFACAARFFVHFLAVVVRLRHETELNTKFFFF